jgi:hypothetical protein
LEQFEARHLLAGDISLPHAALLDRGDFDGDGQLSAADIDSLTEAVNGGGSIDFDANRDGLVSDVDRTYWIQSLRRTYFGDSNLDSRFDSLDLVQVFKAGQYEDEISQNSVWSTGDWNGDGDFTSSDFIGPFQEDAYERGARVPELIKIALSEEFAEGTLWGSITRFEVVDLKGEMTPFAVIQLVDSDISAAADENGRFILPGVPLEIGLNDLRFSVSDMSGTQTLTSASFKRLGEAMPPDGHEYPETRVNTTTRHLQEHVDVATSNGGTIATWVSYSQDGSGSGIFAQRFSPDGTKVGGEFLVAVRARDDQRAPRIDMFEDDRFVIVWESDDQDGSGIGVFGRVFSSDGTPLTGDILLSQTTSGTQRQPQVAVLANGNFAVAWEGKGNRDPGRNDSYGIFTRVFRADGMPLTDERRVNDQGHGHQQNPTITARPGGFAVAWEGDGGPDNTGIYLRQFSSDGMPVGQEHLVNTSKHKDQRQPAIDAADDGRLLVAWTSEDLDGSGWGVYAQQLTSDGAFFGGQLQVTEYTNGTQWRPAAVNLSDEGFVVAWDGKSADDGEGVHIRRFDRISRPIGGQMILSATTRGAQQNVALAASERGFVAAWDGRGEGDDTGIFMRGFSTVDDDAPELTVGLAYDTGESDVDGVTSDPTVRGAVSDESQILIVGASFDSTTEFQDIEPEVAEDGSFELTGDEMRQIFGLGEAIPDGTHTVRLLVEDEFGNRSDLVEFTFVLNTASPAPVQQDEPVIANEGFVAIELALAERLGTLDADVRLVGRQL